VTARSDVDPDAAQRMVNGMELALRFMQKNHDRTVQIALKEFPTLDPKVVTRAVDRMLADDVYPKSVETTAAAFKTGMDTQIALGNLKAQPDYATFVVPTYVKKALALPQ
jgi:NitT/TauT family transport system substrate-binding protein